MSTAIEKRDGPIGLLEHFRTEPMGLVQHFFESGFFSDTRSLSQAVVKMAAGEELGLGPMTSMQGFHVIQGKPTISGQIMAAKVKRSERYDYRVREATAAKCRIEWFQGNESIGWSEYTFEQAQRAGLTGKDNWKKTPEDMLFNRAISRGVRRHCPDILAGATAYVPEELDVEVDGNGDPVHVEQPAMVPDVDPEPVDAEVVPDEEPAPAPVKTISKAEAGRIYDTAVGVEAIEPDQFAQAVSFVLEADAGDLSRKGQAVEVLAGLTEEQAGRVKQWIERKAANGGSGDQEGESNE